MWNSLAALLGSAALSPSLPLSPTLPLLHIFRENNYLSLQHSCNTNVSIMYSGCLKKDVQREECATCATCATSQRLSGQRFAGLPETLRVLLYLSQIGTTIWTKFSAFLLCVALLLCFAFWLRNRLHLHVTIFNILYSLILEIVFYRGSIVQ